MTLAGSRVFCVICEGGVQEYPNGQPVESHKLVYFYQSTALPQKDRPMPANKMERMEYGKFDLEISLI